MSKSVSQEEIDELLRAPAETTTAEKAPAGSAPAGGVQEDPSPGSQAVQEFEEFDEPPPPAEGASGPMAIDLVLDIPVEVAVELGRTKKLVREVLAMVPGSVVELDRQAGEPVDVMVNGRLLARGEVVVIDENFGVRISEVVSRPERLATMR
jgi:flagellar motor switch protein FliN/FliY